MKSNTTYKRRITTWWKYRGEADIIDLRRLQGIVSVISIAQDEFDIPQRFIAELQGLGFEVLNLVDRSWGGYSTAAERKETLHRLLTSCDEKGFSGIDLDYESQPAESRDAYSILIEELSLALRKSGRKLSICVGFYYFSQGNAMKEPFYDFIDPIVVQQYCDEVRVMCYDQYFAPGKNRAPFDRLDCQAIGPTCSQPWARAALQHWLRHVSPQKVVMGLPAYSNDYQAKVGGFGRHCYAPYPPAANWIIDRSWLWFEKVHLYRYQDENGEPHIFYASDSESTKALLEVAEEQEITAISFWHGRSVVKGMWDAALKWRDAI